MIRFSFSAPSRAEAVFRNMDIVHDAAINMLTKSGILASELIGEKARFWSAGAAFAKPVSENSKVLKSKKIILTTTDPLISEKLLDCKQEFFKATKNGSMESVDFSNWNVTPDLAPVMDETQELLLACATPALFLRKDRKNGKWATSVTEVDLTATINHRLSIIAGRTIRLDIRLADGFLENHPKQAVFRTVKTQTGNGAIPALNFTFVAAGLPEDLEVLWYAGVGSKTRLGFGIVGQGKE